MDVSKLKILRRGNYPRWSGWVWCNHNGPEKRGAEEIRVRSEVGVMTQAGTRVIDNEDDAGQETQVATRSFSETPEETRSAGTLTSAPWGWFGISDPQNCMTINLCCFMAVVIHYSSNRKVIHLIKCLYLFLLNFLSYWFRLSLGIIKIAIMFLEITSLKYDWHSGIP